MHTPFRASLLAAAVASLMGFAGAAAAQVTDIEGDAVKSSVGDCIVTGTGMPPDCVAGMAPQAEPTDIAVPIVPTTEATTETVPSSVPVAAFETTATSAISEDPAPNGFVVDLRGDSVKDATGNCIQSGTGAVSAGVTECGGVSFAQFDEPPAAQLAPESAPETAPVTEPATEPAPSARLAPETAPLTRITLDTDTTFAFDSAELTEQGKSQLDEIVYAAKDAERLRVHVKGYADRIGTEEYNLALSQRRADEVKNYFVSKGLSANVMFTEGRGETNPIVQCEGMKGDTLIECLQPNRRSEVEFAALEPVSEQEEKD